MKKEWIIFLSLISLSCNNVSSRRPDDFQFQLIGEIDSYNSSNGHFERKYISMEPERDTTIVFKLSTKELNKAFKIIIANDFFSLPDTFFCNKTKEYTLKQPSFEKVIRVTSNGMTKTVVYNDECHPKQELNAEKRFLKLDSELSKLVYELESVKTLPKTKMVFL
ncbi:hypothetical protein LAG90_09190 [Marinilongibacter aquaticus]|uniref:hypothetical protein n=1 Tax=Marinilongibacter aquaticus TaxID=2975157 RepID=UPI0021BD2B29|nr:hypothetical protein [Marinilongibacter aquaticus]UBM60809.1 hypothetical protein LAG90_09190 [Marinilongibacter aquaticus]